MPFFSVGVYCQLLFECLNLHTLHDVALCSVPHIKPVSFMMDIDADEYFGAEL